MRNIICFDAGFQHLGYMVAQLPEEVGGKPVPVTLGVSDAVLPPKKKRDRKKTVTAYTVERIEQQVDFVRQLHYAYDPVAYFAELPHSGAKSALAIKGMAIATAYLVTTIHLLSRPDVLRRFFLPSAIKKCLCGHNDASKLEIARAVIAYWPEVGDWPGFKVIKKKKTKGKKGVVVEEDKAAAHDATDAGAVCITAVQSPEYKLLWEQEFESGQDIDF